MHLLAVSVVLAFVWAPLRAQTTWIVDDSGGPGVHFTSLPAAVAAAASGDTLLVAPGHYAPFHVTGKALTILGDGPASTVVDGPPIGVPDDFVRIMDPPTGQVFRLSGLRLRTIMPAFQVAYVARLALVGTGAAAHGSVVVHDVVAEIGPVSWVPAGLGLRVDGLVAHFARCEFEGAEWWQGNGSWGYSGAWMRNGAVVVADSCTFRGGSVTLLGASDCRGGAGVEVSAATVWLTRCNCYGGAAPSAPASSFGGDGVLLHGGSAANLFGSSQHLLVGGACGAAPASATGAGIWVWTPSSAVLYGPITTATTTPTGPVSPSVGGNGTLVVGQPQRPQLSLTGTALSGASLAAAQPVTLRIDQGVPGQLFALLLDTSPQLTMLLPLTAEPLLLANPVMALAGLLDGAGAFAVTFVPAIHTPQLVGLPLHLQAFEFNAAAGMWRGSNAEIHRVSP